MIPLLYLFNSQNIEYITTKLILSILLVLIITSIIHTWYSNVLYWNLPFGYKEENGDKVTFFDVFYYNIITWYSIGYGDFSPKHVHLKLLSILTGTLAYIIMLI